MRRSQRDLHAHARWTLDGDFEPAAGAASAVASTRDPGGWPGQALRRHASAPCPRAALGVFGRLGLRALCFLRFDLDLRVDVGLLHEKLAAAPAEGPDDDCDGEGD